jgi:spore germination protein KC
MRKITHILLISCMLLGLSGCWSAKELSDLAIVTSLGIDKTEEGYKVSIQLVNPGAISTKAGGGSLVPYAVYSAEGKSIFEALRRVTTLTPRRPYFAHLRVVVFSEETAKLGIRKPLDLLSRDHEMRTDFVIVIAKGMKAETPLTVLPPLEKIQANKTFQSIENSEKSWAATKVVLLDELIRSLVSDGKEPVLTGLELLGSPDMAASTKNIESTKPSAITKIGHIGVFNEDKFVAWLDEEESKGFNYITDNVTGTLKWIECDGGTISIEVLRSKTDMKGSIEKGKPTINLNVSAEANIGEVECPIDLSKADPITDLEKQFNKKLEEIILSTVEKAKELETDIFGFGEVIARAEQKKWETLKKNWDEEFLNTDVEVKVDIKIRRTGTITEPYHEE